MTLNKYVVKNTLSGLTDGIYLYKTDAFASKKISGDFASLKFDLSDYVLYCIGTYDSETMIETCSEPVLVPWNVRGLVESDATANPDDVLKDIYSK